MTRINAGIPVEKLCDQHLLAEHREIVRVRLTQYSKQNPYSEFTLGKGHVIFFKDKLGFIFERYNQLYDECIKRGFDVVNMSNSFIGFDLTGFYVPSENCKSLLRQRIVERLSNMKRINYKREKITTSNAIKIITL